MQAMPHLSCTPLVALIAKREFLSYDPHPSACTGDPEDPHSVPVPTRPHMISDTLVTLD